MLKSMTICLLSMTLFIVGWPAWSVDAQDKQDDEAYRKRWHIPSQLAKKRVRAAEAIYKDFAKLSPYDAQVYMTKATELQRDFEKPMGVEMVDREYKAASAWLVKGVALYFEKFPAQFGQIQMSQEEAQQHLEKYPKDIIVKEALDRAHTQKTELVRFTLSRQRFLGLSLTFLSRAQFWDTPELANCMNQVFLNVNPEDTDVILSILEQAKSNALFKTAAKTHLERWFKNWGQNPHALRLSFKLYPDFAKKSNPALYQWILNEKQRRESGAKSSTEAEMIVLYMLLRPDEQMMQELLGTAMAELEHFKATSTITMKDLVLKLPTVYYIFDHAWQSEAGLSETNLKAYSDKLQHWKGTRRLLGIFLLVSMSSEQQAINIVQSNAVFIYEFWARMNLSTQNPKRDVLISEMRNQKYAVAWWMNSMALLALTPELSLPQDVQMKGHSRFLWEAKNYHRGDDNSAVRLRQNRGPSRAIFKTDVAAIRSMMWRMSDDPKSSFKTWRDPDEGSRYFWNKVGRNTESSDWPYMTTLFNSLVQSDTQDTLFIPGKEDFEKHKQHTYRNLIVDWPKVIGDPKQHKYLKDLTEVYFSEYGDKINRFGVLGKLTEYLYLHTTHDKMLTEDDQFKQLLLKQVQFASHDSYAALVYARIYSDGKTVLPHVTKHLQKVEDESQFYLWSYGHQQLLMLDPQHPLIVKRLSHLEAHRDWNGAAFVIWWIHLHQGKVEGHFPAKFMSKVFRSGSAEVLLYCMKMNPDILIPYSKSMRSPMILKELIFIGSAYERFDPSLPNPPEELVRRVLNKSNALQLQRYLGLIDLLEWKDQKHPLQIKIEDWEN